MAQNLLAAINDGDYLPGARLPAYADVAAEAGVSRATAREAFLALELVGALEVRHGDGTFVRGSDSTTMIGRAASLFAPPRDLVEARLHIEPTVAALAAERSDEDRIAALQRYTDEQGELVDQPDQLTRFVALGLEFHADLAPGCGNVLLADIVCQLVNVERHPLWALVNQYAAPDLASRQRQVDEHGAIVRALGQRRPQEVSALMQRHIGSLARAVFEGSGLHHTMEGVRP
ncbi:FadR/GntR family transcriptional regulator [Pedococcus sp. 5OH_020]|uniref:FadR/GntR family transcriptional regulator n=1 Tax=Pedococcus sp. 5OH_020 TaxID=2989814 RepID=UPI0022E9A568|nr:FCD domain-containing protein [Pedococcus sp. 5OH_020]